jgi:hypothetical protein
VARVCEGRGRRGCVLIARVWTEVQWAQAALDRCRGRRLVAAHRGAGRGGSLESMALLVRHHRQWMSVLMGCLHMHARSEQHVEASHTSHSLTASISRFVACHCSRRAKQVVHKHRAGGDDRYIISHIIPALARVLASSPRVKCDLRG